MVTRKKTGTSLPEAGTDTRNRVLDVAWRLIVANGDATLSLVDVAREVGLSRQTLYLLFGNRAGLLLAMVERMDTGSDIGARLTLARQAHPPQRAFEPCIRLWFDYLPKIFPVARALNAAAAAGDVEARAAIESRMKLLRGHFLQMARALQDEGALRAGWTPASAADWMFALTHVHMWQRLVVDGGWKPKEAIDRTVACLRDALLSR